MTKSRGTENGPLGTRSGGLGDFREGRPSPRGTHERARKLRVGVQLKSGAYVPPGTTTMGSVIQFVQKTPEGAVDGPTLSCTTDAADVVTSTTTYCNTLPALNDNDTLVVTQVSAPTGLVVDPTEMTVPPCQTIEGLPFCLPQLAIFTDGGVAPTTTDDAADVVVGDSVDVPVLANDDLAGAPITDLQITGAPAHGTATGARAMKSGRDRSTESGRSFEYCVSTSAGTSY